MNESKKVKVHFFVDGECWAARFLYHVPRDGDEVRFHDDKYFTVKCLVWPMDEEVSQYERCNIELIKTNQPPPYGVMGKNRRGR